MSTKLKPTKGTEALRKLQRAGFMITRRKGNMYQLRHPETGFVTYVHVHRGRDIPTGTLRAIIKQAGITVKEFNRL